MQGCYVFVFDFLSLTEVIPSPPYNVECIKNVRYIKRLIFSEKFPFNVMLNSRKNESEESFCPSRRLSVASNQSHGSCQSSSIGIENEETTVSFYYNLKSGDHTKFSDSRLKFWIPNSNCTAKVSCLLLRQTNGSCIRCVSTLLIRWLGMVILMNRYYIITWTCQRDLSTSKNSMVFFSFLNLITRSLKIRRHSY